jgi:peptide/nickel transport system ATP-binding protein
VSRRPALLVEDLSVAFTTRAGGTVPVLDRVGFAVGRGETVALVGESGSGKSVTALACLGLLDPAGRVLGGRALLGGVDMLAAGPAAMAALRGREIAMVFQNPRASLNPIRAVGRQIADVLVRHGMTTRREAPRRAAELLRAVGVPDPERRVRAYPFELSGGLCQRVMIAIAIAASPSVLIADEPTTGLDVTTQALVMDLLGQLAAERGMGVLLITHDLALASERAARVVVMHAGHVVEDAPASALGSGARHPYTARLLASLPQRTESIAALSPVPGRLPDLAGSLPFCRYAGRCERHAESCNAPVPVREVAPGHRVLCARAA